MALVVHEEEGEDEVNLRQTFESNPVTQEEFGEYVASLHSYNGSTFILQFEVLITTIIIYKLHTNEYYLHCSLWCQEKRVKKLLWEDRKQIDH